MHPAYQHDRYLLHRQVISLTGKFRLYDDARQLRFFSQQKMFRIREDIRVYSSERRDEELLYIQARHIIDFSAAYDVIDSLENTRVGVLRRKGFNSLVRDQWEVLDSQERQLGVLIEDSLARALLRRVFLGRWLPQGYDLIISGERLAQFRQRFNLLRYELLLDFSRDPGHRFDRRLGIAGAILLATIEGRQE